MTVNLAGLNLKNPIVVTSSPLTSHVDLLKVAEDNDAAAASLKLTFSRLPFAGKLRSYSVPNRGLLFGIDRRLSRDEGLELMRRGKEETSLVLLANITNPLTDIDSWISLARDFQDAGADAIEANMTCPHIGIQSTKFGKVVPQELYSGGSIGMDPAHCFAIIESLKKNLHIPVIAKPYPLHPRFVDSMKAIYKAGADAVSISTTISDCLPSPDIYNEGKPLISLLDNINLGTVSGNPLSKHSTFGKVAIVNTTVPLPIVAAGGVTNWSDVIEMIMWGASAVGICTHIMWYGFEAIPRILKGIRAYEENQDLDSLDSIRGIATKYLAQPNALRILEGSAVIDHDICNGCGKCLKPGHCVAITMKRGKARVEKDKCIGCSVCVSVCDQHAIHMEVYNKDNV